MESILYNIESNRGRSGVKAVTEVRHHIEDGHLTHTEDSDTTEQKESYHKKGPVILVRLLYCI